MWCWGGASRAAELRAATRKSPGAAVQKSPAKLMAEATHRVARLGERPGSTKPLTPNPFLSQQPWNPLQQRCAGLSYCLVERRSEPSLPAWCRQPSAHTPAGVAHHTS